MKFKRVIVGLYNGTGVTGSEIILQSYSNPPPTQKKKLKIVT